MKITGIKVRQVEVPLIEPFRISLGVITHSRSAIVSVETDEGLVGYFRRELIRYKRCH